MANSSKLYLVSSLKCVYTCRADLLIAKICPKNREKAGKFKLLYATLRSKESGLTFFLTYGLTYGMTISGLTFFLTYGLTYGMTIVEVDSKESGLTYGLTYGLIYGMTISGLTYGLTYGMTIVNIRFNIIFTAFSTF
jgi:hypothetical protein